MTLGDALIDAGEELNMEKLLRMAILHEICEVRTGDIPYPAVRYLGRDVKKNAEKMAVRDMVASLGNWGSHYGEVFESFENGEGLEAEVVRAADKLEMLLQAFEYELCGHGGLQDFWDNEDTFADIEINEFLTLLLAQLRKVREKKLEEGSSRWDDFA
jgi:putative hydrolase of HD superfamily